MKVSDYIANALAEIGCSVVFGYQGSSVANLIDAIALHPSLEFVEARNEQGAAFAANGYALAKGDIGVALACSGPGALNLISGIANAYYDSVPCLFLTGQVSQNEMKANPALRQFGFQETDIVSIVGPITKYAASIVDPDDVPHEFEKAVATAMSGRKGPVLIDFPHNVQKALMMDTAFALPSLSSLASLCQEEWGDIYKRIDRSKRPVIIIGGGCSDIPLGLQRELGRLNVPILSSYRGKGNLDNASDAYCGTLGVFGEKAANWALKHSDLALCFGTRLDGRQTAYEPLQASDEQNVIVFDIDDAELAKHPDDYLGYRCDAGVALRNIVGHVGKSISDSRWLETVRVWRKRYPVEREYRLAEGVNPNTFLAGLSQFADRDANFVLDVGQNQLWANASLSVGEGQHLIQSAGLGAMGFALPAAIGAYCATGKQTLCITGDGGFQMNVQELQVVDEYKIPLKILLLNNGCLGLIRDYQHKALGGRYYGSIEGFGSPDYSLIADAYGLQYARVNEGGFDSRLVQALQDDRSVLIEVSVSQDSTACPEPAYGKSILNQSVPLSAQELEQIRKEAYGER